MSPITITQLEPELTQRLEQSAAQHGRTIEAEIRAILQSVLLPQTSTRPDLATAISRRFAPLGDFEIPEIPRDPIREVLNFETTES